MTDQLRYTPEGTMEARNVAGSWERVPRAAQLAIENIMAFEISRRDLLTSPLWVGRDRVTVLELLAGRPL